MTKQELKSEIESFRSQGYTLIDNIEVNSSHLEDGDSVINSIELCISGLKEVVNELA
tara:strand:+ start:179 stop:349 length:171 start_codon:yes stop_codon:yes gene_type:complete